MNKKCFVKLTNKQCQHLEKLISSGIAPVRTITREHILLKTDCSSDGPNWTYARISEAFNITFVTISKVCKRFVESGFEAVLYRKKPDREYKHRLDGEAEAHLIAMVCSQPPEGYKQWSLRLIRDRFDELDYVDTISHETICTTQKKMNLSPGERSMVHTTQIQRRFCVLYGRCTRSLHSSVRSTAATGVHRWSSQTDVSGNPRPASS